jgi:hypothetical protein
MWRTHKPVAGEDGVEPWIGDPEKMSTYERYFGLKTPQGWAPTPISDLLYATTVFGSGELRDPSRGYLVPPKGNHPYESKFGKFTERINLLSQEVEDELIRDADRIYQALQEVQPSLTPIRAIRSGTKIRKVTDRHGVPGWEISGTRHQNVLVPSSQVSPDIEKEKGYMEGLLDKDLEEFPELAELMGTLGGDMERVVKSVMSKSPSLRGRMAHPGGREKVRDLVIRLVQSKVDEAINKIDLG